MLNRFVVSSVSVMSQVGRRCLFILAVLLTSSANLMATPVVTGFSPLQGPNGTVMNVTGSGFTGTSHVYFEPSNLIRDGQSTVLNDSTLRVVVPPREPNSPLRQGFLVQSNSTATLALADDAIQVTGTASFFGGDNYYWVRSGGNLWGGAGSALIYVDAGGFFHDTGGGQRTVVVEAGGTVIGASGGSLRVYAETGSHVELSIGGTQSLIELTDVSHSLVSDFYRYGPIVPEPSSIIMGLMGAVAFGAIVIRQRRRHQSHMSIRLMDTCARTDE